MFLYVEIQLVMQYQEIYMIFIGLDKTMTNWNMEDFLIEDITLSGNHTTHYSTPLHLIVALIDFHLALKRNKTLYLHFNTVPSVTRGFALTFTVMF